MEKNKKIISFAITLILLAFVDLLIGESNIRLLNLFSLSKTEKTILFDIRLPEVLNSLVVGLSLGLGGSIMQTILNNPLADPFTLGVSSAAGFGASLFLSLGLSLSYIAFGSIGFSLLSMVFVYRISRKKEMNTEDMILAGIAVKLFFDSLISLLQYLASEETLSSIVFWLFGNVNKTSYKQILIIAIVFCIVLFLSLRDSWKLMTMRFGETRAEAMGIDTSKLKIKSFIMVSILAAISVSFVGIIGFIGIISPHFARKLVGEDQRYYLSLSSLIGAMLLVISSMLSKLIKSGVIIPIGIISALVGLPLIFITIFGDRDARS